LCPSGTLLRSASSALPTPSDTVYVADTIGEMGLWFRLAPVALLGGSWAQVGGHNPHEPLALGCRVLHGPNVENFSESYSDLDSQGLSQLVIETTDMAHAVNTTWTQPSTQTTAQPHQARELLESLIRLART